MHLEYIWIILAVILLLLELWAINIVLRSTGGWVTKGLWIVVLIFVPLLGLIAWAMFGPSAKWRRTVLISNLWRGRSLPHHRSGVWPELVSQLRPWQSPH